MTEEKKWKVYCHTNKINGKKYIGITSRNNLNRRFRSGKGYLNCPVFYKAILKYGWSSFETQVLYDQLTRSEALQLEYELVNKFNTKDSRYGYNMIDGGNAAKPISEEGRLALSLAARGTNNAGARAVVAFDLHGKRLAEFPCIVYAERHYGLLINRTHLKSGRGTCHDMIFRYKDEVGDIEQLPKEQVYKKHEQRLVRGDNSWHSTPVTIFDAHTGEYIKSFSCVKYANEYIGANCSSNLTGRSKSVKGYVCKLSAVVEGVSCLPPDQLPDYSSRGKAVHQYDLSGNFIRTYSSAASAERETGVNRKQISNCIRGASIVGGGYLWKLSTDDSPLRKPLSAYESEVANGLSRGTSVDQIDLKTGKVVATYPSLGQAARSVGTYVTSIRKIIDHVGNNRSAKGYGWRYHDSQG